MGAACPKPPAAGQDIMDTEIPSLELKAKTSFSWGQVSPPLHGSPSTLQGRKLRPGPQGPCLGEVGCGGPWAPQPRGGHSRPRWERHRPAACQQIQEAE